MRLVPVRQRSNAGAVARIGPELAPETGRALAAEIGLGIVLGYESAHDTRGNAGAPALSGRLDADHRQTRRPPGSCRAWRRAQSGAGSRRPPIRPAEPAGAGAS